MSIQELELLSPAGNLDIFKSVICAGADAVYFGGEMFGARAFAKNFTMDEGCEAIRYAHLYGKSAYLTVNTLLKNVEIERHLYEYIRTYYEAGIDAVIVQDMGVFSMLHSYFPELPLHASTQMTITGADGAAFLQKMGATRIVTARELSIAEIHNIYDKTGVEIETFIHGALCVCYSGQCLMSSMLGGRSGNRGRCAQPCRLPYTLWDEHGKKCSMPGEYLLSPKDLCGIEQIKSLAEAGVYSFKIEGRMKQKEYATGVVSLYRKYMDAYLEGKDVVVSKADQKRIFDLGNRKGFTQAYFTKQNDPNMITYTKPSHEKSEVMTTEDVTAKLPLQGVCQLRIGKPAKLTITYSGHKRAAEISICGESVESAARQPITKDQVLEKLQKTGNTPFVFEHLSIDLEEGAFMPMGKINELRRTAIDQLQLRLEQNNTNKRSKALPMTKLIEREQASTSNTEKPLLVVCHTKEQCEIAMQTSFVKQIALPLEMFLWDASKKRISNNPIKTMEQISQTLHDRKKECFLLLPVIFREKEHKCLGTLSISHIKDIFDGVIACSYDELEMLDAIGIPKERVLLDHRLYTFSNRSVNAFREMGYCRNTAPLELNAKELMHRDCTDSYMPVYGRMMLMVTANCQNANCYGCNKTQTLLFLEDRYKERFPVKNNCTFCYNELYNSKIYNILSENQTLQSMGLLGYRMDFTLEQPEEMKKVLAQYERTFCKSVSAYQKAETDGIYTKGHFKRGVE